MAPWNGFGDGHRSHAPGVKDAASGRAKPPERICQKFKGMALRKSLFYRLKQISQREEREAKESAGEIKIMARVLLIAPTHRGKHMKCFKDVGEYDDQQACRAE